MAFVSRSEKRLPQFETNSVGPGAYMPQVLPAPSHSYAPFSSIAERQTSSLFPNTFTPGPGSYSSAPAGSLNPWGHSKCSPAFASQIRRFAEPGDSSVPGPGSYRQLETWTQQKQFIRDLAGVNWTRIPSAPSIPTARQSHGYDQTKSGELVMQQSQEVVHSGTIGDTVGPGQYEVITRAFTKGPKWVLSKNDRGQLQKSSTGPSVGPGSYYKERPALEVLLKTKKTPAFNSATKREEIKIDTAPGPGAYEIEMNWRGNKASQVMQNFGSGSPRFKKRLESAIGPGYYREYSKTESKQAKVPFSSGNSRFTYSNNNNPGPGAYTKFELLEGLRKDVKSQGAFGSTQRRFYTKQTLPTPGPGHYKVDKRRKKNTKESAVFASKVKRESVVESLNNPPPGSYEVSGIYEINAWSRSKSSRSDVAFASSTARFELHNQLKIQPGPGAYDIEVGQKAARFFTKEVRFKEVHETLPGPGAYYEEGPDVWNKKSYNVLFSDIL